MAYAERTKGKLTGRWCADVTHRYTDGLTKRFHKAFASKGEAEGFEAYVRATGDVPPGIVSTPTRSFAAAAARFEQRNSEWFAGQTGVTNAQRLRWAVDFLGKDDVTHIRKGRLEQYAEHVRKHAGVRGKPPANRTVNYYLDAVSKVLRDCFEHEELQTMPAFPRMKNSGKTRAGLTENAERQVCAVLASRGHETEAFLVHVLAGTGMRRGELYAIRPEQIEKSGIVLHAEQTKTDAARWVPLLPEACSKLRALIAAGKLPVATQLYRHFKSAAKTLGDGTCYTIHGLRHTTITRLLESGANVLDVQIIVGHRNAGTTRGYYHPTREHLFSVAQKVQNLLGEIAPKREVVQLKPLSNRALTGYGL